MFLKGRCVRDLEYHFYNPKTFFFQKKRTNNGIMVQFVLRKVPTFVTAEKAELSKCSGYPKRKFGVTGLEWIVT